MENMNVHLSVQCSSKLLRAGVSLENLVKYCGSSICTKEPALNNTLNKKLNSSKDTILITKLNEESTWVFV